MSVLTNLQPKRVFEIFETIASIPHGSGNTSALGDWCVAFAQKLGLDCVKDPAGNVVVYKPGSAGREEEPPIILQAHLDMVCAKQPDCTINFAKDGLTLETDGTTVWAKGTTLGADNGIGVAMILAILEDGQLSHPPIEGVLTADEETGLIGAGALDGALLHGRRMINLDSEDEGIFTCGCAGGSRTTVVLPVTWVANQTPAYRLELLGFTGGHSGVEIHKGRHNANWEMAKFLQEIPGVAIGSFSGGELENAIAKQATCVITFAGSQEELTALAQAKGQQLLSREDPDITITVQPAATPEKVWDQATTRRVLDFITTAPSGVQAMCEHLPDVVETSLNLGVATMDDQHLTLLYALRSSVEARREELHRQVSQIAEEMGGTATSGYEYPAWEYIADSALRSKMEQVFEECYGRKPVTEVIHAGLECGLFSQKCPGLDAVSMGPDMKDVHTPDERVWVVSVCRVYEYLRCLLASL